MSKIKNFFRDAAVKVGTKIGKKICDKIMYGDDVFFDNDNTYLDPFAKIIIEYDRNDQIKSIRNIQTRGAAEELCWRIKRAHYVDASWVYGITNNIDLLEKEHEYNKTHGKRYIPAKRVQEMRVKFDGESCMIV